MKVTASQCFETDPHRFSADASDLRIPPGEEPPALLDTDMGNGQPLILHRVSRDRAEYLQSNGCITLVVWND